MGILNTAIDVAFRVYTYLIIIRIFLSWIPHNPYQPVIKFIYEVTEPYLKIFRKIIPPIGTIDLSPIAAFIVLHIILYLLHTLLYYLQALM